MARKKVAEESSPEPYLVGYARVSTLEQRLDMQLDALRRVGVRDDNLHVEKTSATSKKRPALDLAIKDLRPGDTLVVWRLDRLARSMRDLYERLDQIKEAGAGFKSLTENFDFTSATGRLILGFLGLMAEFERQLTVERTQAGLKARKERGLPLGRVATLDEKKLARIEKMLKRGDKVTAVAKHYGVVVSAIYNYFKIGENARGKRVVTRKN
jgi:DNA invertase Pin-like site-specific DNA recombinase